MNSPIPEKCTVLIIGGGPGGAMAAALLAQKGVDVVVLEKEQFPRAVVGESLIPHFWKYLDLIDVADQVMNAGFVAKCGGAALWRGKFRKMSFADFGFDRPGLHVERGEFDKILLDRAAVLGASVFFKTKVTKVVHNEEWSKVIYKNELTRESQTIQARYIVDASGQSALLGKQEKIRFYDDGFRFHAFWGYYQGGNYLDNEARICSFGKHFSNRPLTVISSIGEWGWVWQILLRDKVSIGVILPQNLLATFKKRGANMVERFESMVKDTPLVSTLMKDATLIPGSVNAIKDYAYKPSHLVIGNSFLIGDAAAFVDPINSAGVVMALYGGYLASWSIVRALNAPRGIENIKDMFSYQLKLRLDLFRLIAFPGDLVSEKMIDEGRRLLNQLDRKEKELAMTQITLTNRAQNLPELLGLPIEKYSQNISLSQILATNRSIE